MKTSPLLRTVNFNSYCTSQPNDYALALLRRPERHLSIKFHIDTQACVRTYPALDRITALRLRTRITIRYRHSGKMTAHAQGRLRDFRARDRAEKRLRMSSIRAGKP